MNKPSHAQWVKGLCKIAGRDVLPEVKLSVKRKPRTKETKPREQPERELRKEVIKALRKKGCKVTRIENGITGKNNTGIPDLLIWHPLYGMYWCELKAKGEKLKPHQEAFRELCLNHCINHIVIDDLADLPKFFKVI